MHSVHSSSGIALRQAGGLVRSARLQESGRAAQTARYAVEISAVCGGWVVRRVAREECSTATGGGQRLLSEGAMPAAAAVSERGRGREGG